MIVLQRAVAASYQVGFNCIDVNTGRRLDVQGAPQNNTVGAVQPRSSVTQVRVTANIKTLPGSSLQDLENDVMQLTPSELKARITQELAAANLTDFAVDDIDLVDLEPMLMQSSGLVDRQEDKQDGEMLLVIGCTLGLFASIVICACCLFRIRSCIGGHMSNPSGVNQVGDIENVEEEKTQEHISNPGSVNHVGDIENDEEKQAHEVQLATQEKQAQEVQLAPQASPLPRPHVAVPLKTTLITDIDTRELVAGPCVLKLGFAFNASPPNPMMIKRVGNGTWASEAGIQVGDTLLSLNGVEVSAIETEVLKEAMTQRPLSIRISAAPKVKDKTSPLRGPHADISKMARMSGAGVNVFVAGPDVLKLGFTFYGQPPDPVIIKRVRHDTWASDVGMHAGDVLVALNGVDVIEMRPGDFKSAMQVRPLTVQVAKASEIDGASNWSASEDKLAGS